MTDPWTWGPLLVVYIFFFAVTFCHQGFDNGEDAEDAFAMALLWPVFMLKFLYRAVKRLPIVIGRVWND